MARRNQNGGGRRQSSATGGRRRNSGGGGGGGNSAPPPPISATPTGSDIPAYNPSPMDFSAPAMYSGQNPGPPRGVQPGEGIPNFGGGANGTTIPAFTMPAWDKVLQHYQPPNPGLPLTGYGEQARNQLENALSSDMAGYGAQYSQIAPQYNLQNQRIQTNQGIDTQHTAESLADRGIFNSGITNTQLQQLAGMYNRQHQDLISNAQQQATGVTQGVSGAVGNYYSGLADLYNQIAATEYQNPNSPVPTHPAGGGNQGGGNNSGGGGGGGGGGGNQGGGGKKKKKTSSGRRNQT